MPGVNSIWRRMLCEKRDVKSGTREKNCRSDWSRTGNTA